jgi:hypothetical protein
MYEMTKREQSALARRREEVEQQLARFREGARYTFELSSIAQGVMSDINLTAQEKILGIDYFTVIMLEGARRHGGLLPGTEETVLAQNEQYHQFAEYAQVMALQQVLAHLQRGIAEGLPEEEGNPIARFFQGR